MLSFCSFTLQIPLLNFSVEIPNVVSVFLTTLIALVPGVMPERRLPRTGYGAGLVWSLSSNAVLAPANGNEMLVFHGMQQHLDLLWLNGKKFLLTQSLGGPNVC